MNTWLVSKLITVWDIIYYVINKLVNLLLKIKILDIIMPVVLEEESKVDQANKH